MGLGSECTGADYRGVQNAGVRAECRGADYRGVQNAGVRAGVLIIEGFRMQG